MSVEKGKGKRGRKGAAVKKENWMGGSKRGEGMRKGEEKEGIGLGKRMGGRKGGQNEIKDTQDVRRVINLAPKLKTSSFPPSLFHGDTPHPWSLVPTTTTSSYFFLSFPPR